MSPSSRRIVRARCTVIPEILKRVAKSRTEPTWAPGLMSPRKISCRRMSAACSDSGLGSSFEISALITPSSVPTPSTT